MKLVLLLVSSIMPATPLPAQFPGKPDTVMFYPKNLASTYDVSVKKLPGGSCDWTHLKPKPQPKGYETWPGKRNERTCTATFWTMLAPAKRDSVKRPTVKDDTFTVRFPPRTRAASVTPETLTIAIVDTVRSQPTPQDSATLRAMVERRDPARDTTVALKLQIRGDTALVTVTHRNGGRVYRMERSRTELGWVLCKAEMVFVY